MILSSRSGKYAVPRPRMTGLTKTDRTLAELAVAGLHAAVLAPRAEVAGWFAGGIDEATIDELVESERLRAVGDAPAVSGPITRSVSDAT